MKKPASKKATIHTGYESDIGIVINWLKLKKVLTDLGKVGKSGNGYSVAVKTKKTKKDLRDMLKSRFGMFVKVI